MCFSANLRRHFLSQATLGAIFIRIFRDSAQIFSKRTPTSNTTAFHNSIVGRAGLRGGNGGNCPGLPVMKFICFK